MRTVYVGPVSCAGKTALAKVHPNSLEKEEGSEEGVKSRAESDLSDHVLTHSPSVRTTLESSCEAPKFTGLRQLQLLVGRRSPLLRLACHSRLELGRPNNP
jgi:hypothetical protein